MAYSLKSGDICCEFFSNGSQRTCLRVDETSCQHDFRVVAQAVPAVRAGAFDWFFAIVGRVLAATTTSLFFLLLLYLIAILARPGRGIELIVVVVGLLLAASALYFEFVQAYVVLVEKNYSLKC